jgi:diguanylate cyclase (GGDEF)-like protein
VDLGFRHRLAVLAAGVAAVVTLVAGELLPGSRALAFDVAWTAAAICATAGVLAARRTAEPRRRALWSWLTAACVSWLLGQLAWNAFGLAGTPGSPNVADVGWWGFAALAIAGLVRTSDRRGVGYVEALPLIAAAIALTCAVLWPDIMRSDHTVPARLCVLLYPVLYVSAAVVTLQAIIVGTLRGSGGPGMPFVLLGLVAQAFAFILWCPQLLADEYVIGATLIDPLWVIGLLAIGMGGLLEGQTPVTAARPAATSDRGLVLPGVMFVLLIGALVYSQVTGATLGARFVLTVGLSFCGMTLIARGALLARRQRALLTAERDARAALAERETQLERLTARLAEDARRDPLTGLRNRRALAEDLPEVARRSERGYAVVLCDVDHFKAYNDALGHVAGDEALRAIAAILRSELRGDDAAYRYGGEELLIVLHDVTPFDAQQAAERLRRAVAQAAIAHPTGGVLTASIGVAAGTGDPQSLLSAADAALYAAKHGGRDQVRLADAGEAPASPVVHRGSTEPGVRRLRSLLAVSRAATVGDGVVPVLEALAQVIRSELRFATVVATLRHGETVRAEVVLGDQDARDSLLHKTSAWSDWEVLLAPEHDRCGAAWLPAGSHQWPEDMPWWQPPASMHLAADAWDPADALLLPLRDSAGEVLAILGVDEPLSGRRPGDDEIEVLMSVADHGAAVLEQLAHERAAIAAAAARGSEQQLEAVLLLAESLDLRDPRTADHSRTVGQFTRAIAQQLGLCADRTQRIYVAGVLHDLGKLAVPDAVLHKPGKLDEAEWREMRRHPETGARILAHAGLTDVADWVRAHHERIDGGGYPAGLAGEEIPLEARILAVADAYEAMIADRPYRPGMSPEAAQAELRRNAGTQFDEDVVTAFLRAAAPLSLVS